MPRTRKPQASQPSIQGRGRAANTTTSSLPQVYRFGTGKVHSQCKGPTSSVTVEAPLHVQIVGDNVYHVTLNTQELANKIGQLENLDLSNVNVTLNTVNGPVDLNGNLTVDGDFTGTTISGESITATNGTINNLTSNSITSVTVSVQTLDADSLAVTNNATVGGTLGVTGDTSLGSNLTVAGVTTTQSLNVSDNISTNTLSANTGNISTVTSNAVNTATVSATTSISTNGTLDVAGYSTLNDVTANNVIVNGNETIGGTLSVTGASTLSGGVTTTDITSSGTASLSNLAVSGNSLVSGNQTVNGNTSIGGNITVTGTSTLTGDVTMANDLTVAGNSTITGNQTVTGNTTLNGDVTVAGNQTVTGDFTISDDLTVNGTTHLADLETTGSADVGGTLRVDGAINGKNGAVINGQIESDTVRTGEVVADEVRVTNGLYLSSGAEAPDFILQDEKGQPNGVATLDANGKIDTSFLPPVYTTAIVKVGIGTFANSDTAVVVDADITSDSMVLISNYQDIVGDTKETISVGQITVVSNAIETGSFKYAVINPIS